MSKLSIFQCENNPMQFNVLKEFEKFHRGQNYLEKQQKLHG